MATRPESKGTPDEPEGVLKGIPPLFLLHCLAQFVADQVALAARSRKYNILLLLSWLHTVFSAVVVFALEYWALYRLTPLAFRGTDGDGFAQFLGFSLGVLATSSVSQIVAVSGVASILSNCEVACSLLIIVIVAFSIFTAQRDSYREDAQEFTGALHGAAEALERRMTAIYHLTRGEMERIVLRNNRAFVNFFRRSRGLTELEESTETAEQPGQQDAARGTTVATGTRPPER